MTHQSRLQMTTLLRKRYFASRQDGATPLHLAASCGNYGAEKLLVEALADVNSVTTVRGEGEGKGEGKTILYIIV